jgi:hypothetical protein
MERSFEADLGKGAVIPATIVGVIGIIIAGLWRGQSGILAGLLAQFIVLFFFAIHLLVAKISNKLDPIAVMGLAMFSYFAKVIVLGAFLLVVVGRTDPKTLDRTSFGAIAIAVIVAWLGGEIRAFLKLKLQLPLPKRKE